MAPIQPRLTFAALLGAALPLGVLALPQAVFAAEADPALKAAVAASTRSPNNVARDQYRHPVETLAFFGLKPTDTVVEIWPGGGWYTEILAPYLKAKGTLYAVDFWPNDLRGIQALQSRDPALYGKIKLAAFPASNADPVVPAGTADAVLTFRNVHNWVEGYKRNNAPYAAEAFRQIYAMLKPGGVLGIEDHRLPESASAERDGVSGYIKVSTVRKLAEDAGFVFEGASEANANPKDKADYPGGVRTLLPELRGGEQYRAIGESDRMTLRFRKPKT
ncbi:MAG: class I SAM-dependent methyltransferase [Sphingobium sp.]|nr:class I SAM-dependent methyltransferase [Sphingobium sp.]